MHGQPAHKEAHRLILDAAWSGRCPVVYSCTPNLHAALMAVCEHHVPMEGCVSYRGRTRGGLVWHVLAWDGPAGKGVA